MDELVEIDEVSGDDHEYYPEESEQQRKRSASENEQVQPQKKSKLGEGEEDDVIEDHSPSRESSVQVYSDAESVEFEDLEVDEVLDEDDDLPPNGETSKPTKEPSNSDIEVLTDNEQIEEDEDLDEDPVADSLFPSDGPSESPIYKRIVEKYILPGENFTFKLKMEYTNEKEKLLVSKAQELHNIYLRSTQIHFDHKNGHSFDATTNTFNFTVALVFRYRRSNNEQLVDGSYISPLVYENDNIESIIRNFLVHPPDTLTKNRALANLRGKLMRGGVKDIASVYLALPLWHRKRYQEVDPSRSLLDSLRGRTVIDRPTYVILLKEDVPKDGCLKIATEEDWENTRRYVKECHQRYFKSFRKVIIRKLEQGEKFGKDKFTKEASYCLNKLRINQMRKYAESWQELEQKPLHGLPTQQLVDVVFFYTRYMVDGNKKSSRYGFPSRLYAKCLLELRIRGYKLKKLELKIPAERTLLQHNVQKSIAEVLRNMEFKTSEEIQNAKKARLEKPTPKQIAMVDLTDETAEKLENNTAELVRDNLLETIVKTKKQPTLAPVKKQEIPSLLNFNVRQYGDAPRVVRSGHPYEIVQVERCSFEDYKAMQDMSLLINFRHHHTNVSPYFFGGAGVHTNAFLETAAQWMQLKWSVDITSVFDHSFGKSNCARVHLKRTSTIVTGGRGINQASSQAVDEANGSVMLALCFMQVVPFEMFAETMSRSTFDKNWVKCVAYACRERFRHLVALSESDEFADLLNFTGDFTEPLPANLQDLYVQFMLKMRASGIQYWSIHRVIPISVDFRRPDFSSYRGTYFEFKTQRKYVKWMPVGSCKLFVDKLVAECQVDEQARFGQAPFETGLVKNKLYDGTMNCCPITGAEHYIMGHIEMPKDAVVCLTARDMENRTFLDGWVDDINSELIVEISKYWNKRLVRTHTIQKRLQKDRYYWFHVCTVMFEGVPSFFFMGSGEHVNLRESRAVADSFIISSLCLMGIIPRELYCLIRFFGRDWIAPVLHACRARFAEFDILMRNSFYFPLFNLATAHLWQDSTKIPPKPIPKLLPVAYEFYQRLRASGATFWQANPVIPVPADIELPQTRLMYSFFTFIKCTDLSDWTTMIPPLSETDTGRSLPSDKDLSEYYTIFEDNPAWKAVKIQDIKPVKEEELEAALEECRVPRQTVGTLSILRDILEKIAELAGCKLMEQITFCPEKKTHQATLYFSGSFSPVFSSTHSSPTEKNSVDQSICDLARKLMRCHLLPYGLISLITNCRDRLPYVLPSLYPMIVKASAIIKELVSTSLNEEEKQTAVLLALSCIRKECSLDSQLISYSMPTELLPNNNNKNNNFSSVSLRKFTGTEIGLQALKIKLVMNIGDSNGANCFVRVPIHPTMPELNKEDLYVDVEDNEDSSDQIESQPDMPPSEETRPEAVFVLPWERLAAKENETAEAQMKQEDDGMDDDEYLD